MNLFLGENFIISLLELFFEFNDFVLMNLFEFLNSLLFFGNINSIHFKKNLFDTVLTKIVIFDFHLQHSLITLDRRPQKLLVNLHLSTATDLFINRLKIKLIDLQPL